MHMMSHFYWGNEVNITNMGRNNWSMGVACRNHCSGDVDPTHHRAPEHCSLRGANLGRKIGESRNVVARKRRRQGKLTAGQLHPVATVACKSDYNCIRKGGLPIVGPVLYRCRHFSYLPLNLANL